MHGSKVISKASLQMAMTETRAEEEALQKALLEEGILASATDFGGNYLQSINKIIERAILVSKRAGIILNSHHEEGAVAGATRDALSQLIDKASGFNVGGKLSVVRYKEHLSVAIFMSIGITYLDEIAVGLAHRSLYYGGQDETNCH